jgi:hypothetical protein
MANFTVSAELLEPTIRYLRDLQAKLEAERSNIDKQLTEVREHIRKLETEVDKDANLANGKPSRRRKGENSRAIAKVFDDHPSGAFTKQEIADKTRLPFSSVQAVLDKEAANYACGEDGLWRRKKSGQ